MSFLVDTNVLSEFFKKVQHPGVMRWFEQTDPESQFISVLTVGELRKGIVRLPASRRSEALEEWLAELIEGASDRILPFTLETANRWASMRADMEQAGRIIPVIDGLIAATALEHGLQIVTRNTADFSSVAVGVINPFE
jgi:predicted nucleic acid-binding protein